MKHLLSLLTILFPIAAQAAIGTVSEQNGTAVEIKRGKESIVGRKDVGIESMDSVNVGSRAETNITFNDNTRVKIKENSRLVIDDFVYDPKKSDAGKMAIKVALGTVQYASGQIAKANQQNMNIKTPTATIAVRGTDFAMTVDEVGKSVIVLLPSCRDPKQINNYEVAGNCTVGVIDVETAAGMVTLNQPFTATYVTDANQPPLNPVKIEANLIQIGNDQNLKLAQTIKDAVTAREEKKISEKDKSRTTEEERKVAKDMSDKASSSSNHSETELIANATSGGPGAVAAANPCHPFNDCGNEKGLNWYHRIDDDRGNVIMIRSGEKMDNTTYSISINSNDLSTKVVGDGSNKVTVRIWNR